MVLGQIVVFTFDVHLVQGQSLHLFVLKPSIQGFYFILWFQKQAWPVVYYVTRIIIK